MQWNLIPYTEWLEFIEQWESDHSSGVIKKRCATCGGQGKTTWTDGDIDYCQECDGDGYTEHFVPAK